MQKGITLKGITRKGITQKGITLKGITQRGITLEGITLKGITLKCHWDQNFGIPYFSIFENSLWLLVTLPNFNSLRRLEVAFFGRFLSRFYGRHYWPLFRKPACELAEVTLEAHLKLSTFHNGYLPREI